MKNKFALLIVLAVSLLVLGCIGGSGDATPTPEVTVNATVAAVTPTPVPTITPTPSIEVTPTPNATLAPETALACGDTAEGKCVSGQPPLFCLNGFKVENCGVCGCPAGLVCGRIDLLSTFKCWDAQFIVNNNGTILKVTSPTPTVDVNATPTPTPTPTPNPTIAPLPSPTPNSTVMKEQLQQAIKDVFNKSYYFQGTGLNEPGTLRIFVLEGLYRLDFYFYERFYGNWTGLEQERVKQFNETSRYNFVLWLNDTANSPNEFHFKQECYNWAYSVDVIVKDTDGTTYNNKYGYKLAKAVNSYCR